MKLTKEISCEVVPIMQDNYVPLLWHEESHAAMVVDPGTSDEILGVLEERKLHLTDIFLTHHHGDHIGGVKALVAATKAKVTGHKHDVHRLPALDVTVQEGESIQWQSVPFYIMALNGHTIGHIVYHAPQLAAFFCGDVLFGMGCGRLFEGTPQQMFDSLQRIKQLPPETNIFCAHEYTQNNGEFAAHVFPNNAAIQSHLSDVKKQRAMGQKTVPLQLQMELQVNPFLLSESVERFTEIRERRNQW